MLFSVRVFPTRKFIVARRGMEKKYALFYDMGTFW